MEVPDNAQPGVTKPETHLDCTIAMQEVVGAFVALRVQTSIHKKLGCMWHLIPGLVVARLAVDVDDESELHVLVPAEAAARILLINVREVRIANIILC